MHTGMLPHVRLPKFLDAESAQSLLDWVLTNEAEFSVSKVDYGTHAEKFRKSLSATLGKPLRSMLKANVERRLPEILAALGTPAFEHRYEVGIVAYNDGAYLARHVDVRGDRTKDGLQPRVDRRISAVYYFYRPPKAFSGGQLRLHPLRAGAPVDLEVEQNLLVAFPAFAPHEVLPVSCASREFADSRFIVNIWLHPALRPGIVD